LTEIDTKSATVLLRAFAHPTRLAILQELSKGPKCVTDLEDLLPARQANLSQHLALLRHTQLVDFAQDAQTRCYYLARPKLTGLLLEELARNEVPVSKSTEQIKAEKAKQAAMP
jgi:ArsR family transcriptional regulator